MLSLSPIVQVNVNISTPVIAGTAFSTGLILAPTSATLTEDQQLQLFTSAADMRTAGFQATDPAYLAAVAYFAASPAPTVLYEETGKARRKRADLVIMARLKDDSVHASVTDESETPIPVETVETPPKMKIHRSQN